MRKLPLHPSLLLAFGSIGLSIAISATFLIGQNHYFYITLIALLISLTSYASLQLIFLYQMWKLAQNSDLNRKRPSPGKAIGYLFIPLFSYYWVFVLWRSLALHINHLTVAKKIPVRLVSVGCAFFILGIIIYSISTYSILLDLRYAAPASWEGDKIDVEDVEAVMITSVILPIASSYPYVFIGVIIFFIVNFRFYRAASELVSLEPEKQEAAPDTMLKGKPKQNLSAQRLELEVRERKWNISTWSKVVKIAPIASVIVLAASIILSSIWYADEQRMNRLVNLKKDYGSQTTALRLSAAKQLAHYPEAISILINSLGTLTTKDKGGKPDKELHEVIKTSLKNKGNSVLEELLKNTKQIHKEVMEEAFAEDDQQAYGKVLSLDFLIYTRSYDPQRSYDPLRPYDPLYNPLEDLNNGTATVEVEPNKDLASLPKDNSKIEYKELPQRAKITFTGAMDAREREQLKKSTPEEYHKVIDTLFQSSNIIDAFRPTATVELVSNKDLASLPKDNSKIEYKELPQGAKITFTGAMDAREREQLEQSTPEEYHEVIDTLFQRSNIIDAFRSSIKSEGQKKFLKDYLIPQLRKIREDRPQLEIKHENIVDIVEHILKFKDPKRLVELRDVDLTGIVLSGVKLYGADLSGAKLSRADFVGAYLNLANLSKSNLIGANLSQCHLDGADLDGADLSGAVLRGAYLSGVSFCLCSKFEFSSKPHTTKLCGADLRDATLSGIRMHYVDLSRADLRGAYLQYADLSYTKLVGANLGKAVLEGANLEDANLERAHLNGANLKKANLAGANLHSAKLVRADLSEANLEDANLERAHLNGANLKKANLAGADLSGASLDGVDGFDTVMNFTEVDLRGVRGLSREQLKYAKFEGAIVDAPAVQVPNDTTD